MQYVLKTNPAVRQKGMVLGYDGRYHSDKYVEHETLIFTSDSFIKHWLESEM